MVDTKKKVNQEEGRNIPKRGSIRAIQGKKDYLDGGGKSSGHIGGRGKKKN